VSLLHGLLVKAASKFNGLCIFILLISQSFGNRL
jgi:hypothetical protein